AKVNKVVRPRQTPNAAISASVTRKDRKLARLHRLVPKMKTLKAISLVCLCVLTGSVIASGSPAAESVKSFTTPLTFANAVSFVKAAKFRATEVQPRCAIFFEGEWKSANVYNYGVIMVENSDEDVQITFYLTDAHEMNWVTEFLDSQFFRRDETEKLFQLMN